MGSLKCHTSPPPAGVSGLGVRGMEMCGFSDWARESVLINGVSILSRLNLEKMHGFSFPSDKANCLQ